MDRWWRRAAARPGSSTQVHSSPPRLLLLSLGMSNSSDPALAPLHSLNVLFVDDNTLNCKIGHRLLSSLGAQVESATSGEEALAIAAASEFDVILLDCAMPGMSGFEVARELRQGETRNSTARIVALTVKEEIEVRERAQEAGIETVLSKPLGEESLRRVLKVA